MVFEQIETLKKKWTDKYVVVDASQAELRRFEGQTGKVKTVNMSGRALVQFDAYNNIGWIDIDTHFLTVIDAPLPKVAKAPAEAKPKAETKPAAAKPPAGGGKNVADILAAARAGKSAAPAAPAKPAGKMSTADILAAARGKKAEGGASAESAPASEPKKVDPKKMSTADILAAARGKGGTAAPATKAPEPAAEKPAPAAPTAEETTVEPTAEPEVADDSSATGAAGSKKGAFKTVEEIVAYCRKTDAS